MYTEDKHKLEHANLIKNGVPLNTPYHFKVLEKKYINQVVNVFTYAFCRSEPMTQYLKMDEEKYKIFARSVTEKACDDKLSIVALDGDKVVACALIEDIAKPGAIPDFDPKFAYILNLLDSLGHAFFPNKTFPKNHIAHLFITAVDENYRHQGLSTQVNFRAMDLAAQKGFEFIYCELTHPFNEYGIINHLKNPNKLIGSCVYKNFVYQGKKPFANLAGGAKSYLWSIKDDAKLRYTENSSR